MYCRRQGYLSPHLAVLIRYQDPRPIARGIVPVLLVAQGGLRTATWWGYVGFVQHKTPMVLFTATNYGCVFTLSQEDGDELYYAPIYADGSVNLKEFAPVDLDSADLDEMELFDIRNRLVEMCQI